MMFFFFWCSLGIFWKTGGLLTEMLTETTVLPVQLLVQREPVPVHLRFCFVADVQRAGVVFGGEGCDLRLAESDDFVRPRIDDFAEAVAFYRFIALAVVVVVVGECQVELAVCAHVGSAEKVFWQGARADVLHAVFVEIDGSRGVFWIGRVAVGEDVVDDFVLESGEFDFDEAWDVIRERCCCNEWLVGFGESCGT